MSGLKATMHPIKFRLGLCPRPYWGAYSAPSDSLAGFKGPTSKGMGRERREETVSSTSSTILKQKKGSSEKISWSIGRAAPSKYAHAFTPENCSSKNYLKLAAFPRTP